MNERAESHSITSCPNCSAELTGEYCAVCGQQRIDPGDLSARRFFHDLVDEVGTLKKRFKALRSLGALFTPGLLSSEYLAGHRQRFLSPLKLYFVCAAIFFFTAPWAGFNLASLLEGDPSGKLPELVHARIAERGIDPTLFESRFDSRVRTVYTLFSTINVFLIALLLQLLSRRKRIPFGGHVVFALHYGAIMFLLTMMAGGLGRVFHMAESPAAGLALVVTLVYLGFALKRVYAGSVRSILTNCALVFTLTMLLNNAASWAAIALTLKLV
jgi:hypothetical protein